MGNNGGCTEGCYTWFKGYSETIIRLRRIYKQKYYRTLFYTPCMEELEHWHDLPDQQNLALNFHKSLLQSNHYQNSSVSHHHRHNLPARFEKMNEKQKKNIVIELVKKSYMLLDMSDIFEQDPDLKSYESMVKEEIFKLDDSMVKGSFMQICDSSLVSSLKKFDPNTIYKLEEYVHICDKIKEAFEYQSHKGEDQTMLHRLSVVLKAQVIRRYNSQRRLFEERRKSKKDDVKNLEELIINIKTIISILEDTILQVFHIKLDPDFANLTSSSSIKSQKKIESSINASKIEHRRDTEQEEEDSLQDDSGVTFNFLNQINFNTLVSSILFEEESFHRFVENAIKECLQKSLSHYKEKNKIPQRNIYRMLKEGTEATEKGYIIKTNLSSLIDSAPISENPFRNSVKVFNKISLKQHPIIKLKILGELEKEIGKEYDHIAPKQNLPEMIFDRSVAQVFAKWLLHRKKEQNFNNIASIIIAYSFIHPEYRIGSKGSSLTSFLEEVEKIINWSVPG